jgi:hypothetical protein
MLALLLTPAVLSSLVLAAHFLRRGQLLLCALCLGMAVLPLLRRRWVPETLQVFLGLGVLLWIATLRGMVEERSHAGEPWMRLAVILGSVMGVAVLGILLLSTHRVHAHYRDGGSVSRTEAP